MFSFLLLIYTSSLLSTLSSSTPSSSSSSNSFPSTCEYQNSLHLLSLVKESAEKRFEDGLYSIDNLIGPKLSIGIITTQYEDSRNESYYQYNTNNFTAYSFAINEYYAKHNGYYYIINNNSSDSQPFNWKSISLLRNAFNTWGKKMDFLVYTTPDNIFIDFHVRLETLLGKYKKTNILFISGGSMTGSMISSDFIIVRRNTWSQDFLDDLWTYRDRTKFPESKVFEEYYKSNEEDLNDYVTILPVNQFRNDYPAMIKYRPINQILYFPLEVAEYKRNVCQDIFENICSIEKKNKISKTPSLILPFPPTLGLPKDILKMHSSETYRYLWDEKLGEYSSKAAKGENSPFETDRLSTITVYLTSTLSSIDTGGSSLTQVDEFGSSDKNNISPGKAESISILSKTFKQIYLNFKKYQTKLNKGDYKISAKELTKLDENYPLQLKSVLRIGQEYMVNIKTNPKELRTLNEILRSILEDLLLINERDVETQELLVNLNVDLGMDHMSHKRYQQALSDFLSALRVARRVGNFVGDQIVLTPANQAAEAMVMLERYEEAVVLYETVVPLAKKHNGADDLTSGYIYLQAAYANYKFQKYKTAHKLIEQSIEILEMNGIPSEDPKIYAHAKSIEENTRGRKDIDDEINRDYGF